VLIQRENAKAEIDRRKDTDKPLYINQTRPSS
jgi:hypothetical protein